MALTPDHIEQSAPVDSDDPIPTQGYHTLPIIGIGGSAGALSALREFFSVVPSNPGVAFVVVIHLSPDHESALAELLQSATSLTVVKVEKTVKVEPDTVYVIPPRKGLRSMDGRIVLQDLPTLRQRHVAVDLFFRTLADTHGPHATAVVLSGADGDGSIGLKRVKERGGLTIAQDPDEAEHSGMPRSAIGTGMVDWVLPVVQMPARIFSYQKKEHKVRLPREEVVAKRAEFGQEAVDEVMLKEVLAFLRARTGRNFAYYKRATILRRIARRMQVNDVDDLTGYLQVLRTRAGEAAALLQDLLISVTNFFRDGDCFQGLERKIPSLFAGKGPNDTVRVWVVACATGEEAYSVAMLLTEHARTLDAPPAIQVFATDLDEDAIRVARDGLYPATIEADVDETRLRRFFVKEANGMRVRRELRETVLFAVHDALRDSPFSRIDLITCRNFIIYLTRAAQSRLFDTFHFAMMPNALLFLGASESIEEGNHQFEVLEKKNRLFAKRDLARPRMPPPEIDATLSMPRSLPYAGQPQPANMRVPEIAGAPILPLTAGSEEKLNSWGDVHFKLLEHLAPPSIIVDSNYELLHLSRSAGAYLQYAGGEPSRNLLRAIHPSLRIELRAALFQATQSGETVEVPPLSVELHSKQSISMRVVPAADIAPGVMIILIRSLPDHADDVPSQLKVISDVEPVATHLDRELERLKFHLRETVEQYEASNEELKASNEELQAMNEELRSATEELETSREELQSMNEELTTVNQELKSKVEQLSNANSDMHNLMDATEIATIFLDRALRITRYTPSAVSLFSFIPTDIGRPLSDLKTQLEYPNLGADAAVVLERLSPMEREIAQEGGRWLMVRLRPYRTLEDRIAGVVITFVDITEQRNDKEQLRISEERFSAIVSEASVGVVQTDLDGKITFANKFYQGLMGYTEHEILGTSLLDHVHASDQTQSSELFSKLKQHGKSFQIEKRCVRKDGAMLWLLNSANILLGKQGAPSSVLVVCNDVTARKRAEEALRESNERLRLMMENVNEYAIFSTDLQRRVTSWNFGSERLLGYTEEEILGQACDLIYTQADREQDMPAHEAAYALEGRRVFNERRHIRKDGSVFWASGAMMLMNDRNGEAVGYVKILRDQSEERAAREALESSKADLIQAVAEREAALEALGESDASKDRFLAILSHELRNPLAAILSASDLLSAEESGVSHAKQLAEVVSRQSHAMKVLLDDLLDMSRLALNKLSLRWQSVPVSAVVEAAVESVSPLVEAAGHNLVVDVACGEAEMYADPVRLSQVLSNLLSNATKYTPAGGEITLRSRCSADEVCFQVRDNGIGIDASAIESLFEMFKQSPLEGHALNGMGVGLALSRSLVLLHGGEIKGESEGRGQGSTFTVRIPKSLPACATLVSHESAQHAASSGPLRILIIDDNVDAAWLTGELLTTEGHEVKLGHDGASALALAESFEPNVIVLDIGLPDIDGYVVAERIRAKPWGEKIRLIAATGWGQEKDRARSTEAGFDSHLVKPIAADALINAIATLTSRR